MDDFRDSSDSVAPGNDQWLCDWRIYPYPSGDRDRRSADPDHSGSKAALGNWNP